MEIKPEIFKAYDIRGVYPEEINEEAAYRIGRALVSFLDAKKIIVGKDMRESSKLIEAEFIRGVLDQGADVIEIGLATTPMTYFASSEIEADGAVVITASHNPAEYNGFKFCKKDAVPIGEGSGMEEIKRLAIENSFDNPKNTGQGLKNEALKDQYINYIAGFFNPENKKKKIVIDFANAMGIVDKEVFEKFSEKLETVYLYDELDGSFPNHEANPIKPETLEALRKKVVEESADLGISYDGDADRVGFVDEKGEVVPMDYMIAILAKEILKDHPGGLVLMDLRSSNAVKEAIEEAGGRVGRCRVGHSLIKAQMRQEEAIFAGELSGHYFFEENSKAEMTTLAVIKLINLLNESGKTLSELVENLKRYYHSGEINFEVEDKIAVMEKLKEKYSAGKLDEMDGVRIDFEDWWFNVRPSNTEPKLRLNLEANTKELMEEKLEKISAVLK